MAEYPPLKVPSWSIGILFLVFLIITLIWEKMLHLIEHWLHHHNKLGLQKVLHSLKDEILAVGVIILLLPLFEKHLMTICVPDAYSHNAQGYNYKSWMPSGKTADAKADALEEYDKCNKNICYGPDGKPNGLLKLFPYEAIHGIHVFIALTAIVHIIFACVSMLLCLWRVARWRKWERKALESPVIIMDPTIIRSLGHSQLSHAFKSFFNQFYLHVTQPVYAGIRRLFLEELRSQGDLVQLPVDFPFLEYVKETMELSLSKVIGVTPMIWVFAIIQLVVPVVYRAWCVVLICGICVVLIIITGAKLHSVVVHLAARAHYLYSEDALSEHAFQTLEATVTDHTGLGGRREAFDGKPAGGLRGQHAQQDAKMTVDTARQEDAKGGKLKRGHKAQANLIAKHKGYTFRAMTGDDLPNMFWFHRPGLLLWFYKLAYFESAFCATLVLFAFWKDNQFMPDLDTKYMQESLIAFFVAFGVNVLLSFFQSTCVLPVYALVSINSKDLFDKAGDFLQRDIKFKAMHSDKSAAASFRQQEHQNAVDVLQRLASHVKHMEAIAEEAGVNASKY